MLILFTGRGRDSSPQLEPSPRKPCELAEQVDAYSARQMTPELRAAFEQHLIHCGPCQRAVYLGRISNPSISHNRSVGKPCAAHNRRKP